MAPDLRRLRGQAGSKFDQQDSGETVDLDREAAVADHAEHPVVLGQHLGIEDLDAHLVGGLGELAQQRRAQPLALHRVGDLQSDLGPLRPVGLTLPASMADDLTVATSP